MKILVGKTGFVGSNLWESQVFDKGYHSKNIEDAYETCPKLLVYAGLRAEKFLANNNPEADRVQIEVAKENIRRIAPKNIVLISTVDVYKDPNQVSEKDIIQIDGLHPYGYNRFCLEEWVQANFSRALIVRLPALYGKNLKKNFIYDIIHRIPFMLKPEKYEELIQWKEEIATYYTLKENGFYQCKILERDEKIKLKDIFLNSDFSALNFTDSRSSFQFYPLSRLWKDISIAFENELAIFNPATQPLTAAEIYKYLYSETFINELPGKPVNYDYRTIYDDLYSGAHGYIMNKEEVLMDLKKYVETQSHE